MKYLGFFFLVMAGCIEGPKTLPLPAATGSNSEVVFVVDDGLWEHSLDTLATNTFGAIIEGVNQKERLFRIIQVNHNEFKSILKTHTNIVIISEGVMRFIKKNKWASNQLVAQLNWQNNSQKLLQELLELRKAFIKKELRLIKNTLEKSSKKDVEKTILTNFGVKCIVPNEFQVIKNDVDFFWANYDPPKSDEIRNIIMFSFVPRTTNHNDKKGHSELFFKIDSIFGKYLIGGKSGSYVRIEPKFPPYYFENTYRGLWKLENGFMGGPFLVKTHFVKNKIVVNIGLVFAPQSRKRKYIKEFEAIL